jgi:membrane-associated PAP2 superfamily phosphatase
MLVDWVLIYAEGSGDCAGAMSLSALDLSRYGRGINLAGLLDRRDGVVPGWCFSDKHATAGFSAVRLPVLYASDHKAVVCDVTWTNHR